MEHCRSKPERSGKPGGDVFWKLRTGETQYILDGGTSAVSESGSSAHCPVVSMMQSTDSIVRNNTPGVCGTNPPAGVPFPRVRDACGPGADSEHGRSRPRRGSYLMRQHCEREVSWRLVKKL